MNYHRLSDIQREINAKLDDTMEQLRKPPAKPSDDPLSDIVALLHEFTNDIKDHIKASHLPAPIIEDTRHV